MTVSLLEGDEQRSYLTAVPDEMAAENRTRDYLDPAGGTCADDEDVLVFHRGRFGLLMYDRPHQRALRHAQGGSSISS